MGEDLPDDLRVLDARDDAHRPTAGRAGLDIDPKDPLEALCPSHRGAAFNWRGLLQIRAAGMLAAPAPPRRGHPRAILAVRREYTVEACQIDPQFRPQRRQAGDAVEGLEDDVRRAVSVRCLQLITDVAIRGE